MVLQGYTAGAEITGADTVPGAGVGSGAIRMFYPLRAGGFPGLFSPRVRAGADRKFYPELGSVPDLVISQRRKHKKIPRPRIFVC